MDAAVAEADRSGGVHAADAIRTTDTIIKIAFRREGSYTVGGMAKGAGMLAPSLATMLVVLTTDADLSRRRNSTPRSGPRPPSPSTGSTPTAACPPTTPCC